MTRKSFIEGLKSLGLLIYNYKFTILFIAFLLIVTQNIDRTAFSKAALFHAVTFILVMNVLAKMKPRIVSILLIGLLIVFISFDAYFAFVYSSIVTNSVMGAFFETNLQEASEALGAAVWIGVGVIALSAGLIILSAREMKKSILSFKYSLIFLLLYWFVFIPGLVYHKINLVAEWMGEFRQAPLVSISAHLNAHFPLVYGNLATFVYYQHERSQMVRYQTEGRVLPDGVVLSDTVKSADKIILLLGESGIRRHMSLYGYPRPTTPFADSLATTPHLMFHKGIAPAPATRDALRFMLTFANPRNAEPFFTQKSMVDLAKDAGYEVHWISTQNSNEMLGSYVDLIAAEAKQFYFNKGEDNEDLDVVDKIKEVYDENKKQMFILHIQGSHFKYEKRYDETDVAALPHDDNFHSSTINYDRTIHHTDRLLRQLYALAKQDSSSVLCYFPDHGEIVGVGHGFLNAGTAQYEIPVMVFNNSSIEITPVTNRYLTEIADIPYFNTINSIYMMAQFMGYTIDQSLVEQAIVDGQYVLQADGRVYTYQYLQTQNQQ